MNKNVVRLWLWRTASVLSFGILSLLGHWFPRLCSDLCYSRRPSKTLTKGISWSRYKSHFLFRMAISLLNIQDSLRRYFFVRLATHRYPYPLFIGIPVKSKWIGSCLERQGAGAFVPLKSSKIPLHEVRLESESGLFEAIWQVQITH